MKKIIIGRANDSDIIIPDEHDNVSRHHAVITFDFFGKMTLSDTSSNGTLINGTKMLKGTSIPVTRKDKIQLGGAWIFDWNLVEDPYKSIRRSCIILCIVLAAITIGGTSWYVYESYKKSESPLTEIPKPSTNVNTDTWNKDSTNRVAPTETNIKTSDSPKQKSNAVKSKNSNQKKGTYKKAAARDLMKMKQKKDSDKNTNNGEMPVIN
ncbi:FHA domain-containing protein [Sodaliphilus sp.]|uniref:FHA domain-containing protein n=1 Tax=Sodaliphilus sp. TaxID=2815818 RepID=UPI0038905647